jgi:hypothetical protein
VDGGRELRLSVVGENGVNVFGWAETAQTIRIIVEDNCSRVGGIWSPLSSRVTDISLTPGCNLSARTFAGLRFSKVEVEVEVRGSANAAESLKESIAAFDNTPWRITFGSYESDESALSERERDTILSVGGIVQSECFEWSSLRTFGDYAFMGAKIVMIDFNGLSARPARLGRFGFAHSSLEVVELPDSVVDLGEDCFRECRFLRTALLVSGVHRLPNGLFYGCVSLRRIEASNIEEIEHEVFLKTESLRTFDFGCLAPSAPIGNAAFQGSGLTSVVLSGDPARPFGEDVFSKCESLSEAEVNLAALPNGLLYDCSALKRIWMTAHVSQIGSGAFQDCSGLRRIDLSALTPEAEIERAAFIWSGLVEVEFPAKLRSIGDQASYGCTLLASVRLPRGLGRIGMDVFKDCRSLRRLALGDVGTWSDWVAEMIEGGGKLDRLELIGRNLESIRTEAIETWLADNAVVVSAAFEGQRLGRFGITSE